MDNSHGSWSTDLCSMAQSSQSADSENTTAESVAGSNGRIPVYMA